MIYTTETVNTIDNTISRLIFEAEEKREQRWAKRMNRFYDDVIKAASEHAKALEAKCIIEVSAQRAENKIIVSLSLRVRRHGRTIKSYSHNATWKNGVIIKKVPEQNLIKELVQQINSL